jgi:hypothetical protein
MSFRNRSARNYSSPYPRIPYMNRSPPWTSACHTGVSYETVHHYRNCGLREYHIRNLAMRDSTSRKVTANTRHAVICVTEESSTDLVQFQAFGVNGRRGRQTPCVFVWELVSGCYFNSEADESSPAHHGLVIFPYHINFYDPGENALLSNYLKIFRQNVLNVLIFFRWKPTSSYQQFCAARTSRLEGDRYVTRISDNACVMSLQSRAHL